jgi:small subunit ribosomal protein S5
MTEDKIKEKEAQKSETKPETKPEGVQNKVVVRDASETTKGQKKNRGPPRRQRRRSFDDDEKEAWTPKTAVGKRVLAGEISNIDEILDAGLPIMEEGIVDTLVPELSEEVIDVRRVQRTLDSGRRMRFSILVVIGDKNGHAGVGLAKGVEAGPTIKKAITKAKLNIIRVPRSCSSWECGCGEPHTVPVTISGKKGSVTVKLKPAPKGVGLVASDNSKILLEFAGIQDVWTFSEGYTRTTINQILALYDALKKLSTFKTDISKKKFAKNKEKE